MKRILITGAGSYIGTSMEAWLKQERFSGKYQVDTVDMRGEEWKRTDFSGYDTVFHVAGIAHQRETKKNAYLYYQVNRDLAVETALKAKKDGVKQFIFLSSMSVYGLEEGTIDGKTPMHPRSHYGKSKLAAEKRLKKLASASFRIVVLRPPMIYGPGCRGNYPLLSQAAKRLPLFPYIRNRRSMLYIENLCIFVQDIIDTGKKGLFCPQNTEYVCTGKMVKDIAAIEKHRIFMLPMPEWSVKLIPLGIVKKVFGSLIYQSADFCPGFYSYEESLIRTEKPRKGGGTYER